MPGAGPGAAHLHAVPHEALWAVCSHVSQRPDYPGTPQSGPESCQTTADPPPCPRLFVPSQQLPGHQASEWAGVSGERKAILPPVSALPPPPGLSWDCWMCGFRGPALHRSAWCCQVRSPLPSASC